MGQAKFSPNDSSARPAPEHTEPVVRPDPLRKLVHDVRSPLGAMVGWLHLLRADPDSVRTRDTALAGLDRAVTQLRALLDAVPANPSSATAPAPATPTLPAAGAASGELNSLPAAQAAPGSEPSAMSGTSRAALPLYGVHALIIDAVEASTDNTLDALALALVRLGATMQRCPASGATKIYSGWARGAHERVLICALGGTSEPAVQVVAAIRRIEQQQRLARIPALAIGAATNSAGPLLRAGFDAVLDGQVSGTQLHHALSRMLGRRAPAD